MTNFEQIKKELTVKDLVKVYKSKCEVCPCNWTCANDKNLDLKCETIIENYLVSDIGSAGNTK